jgi:hypothetical protein
MGGIPPEIPPELAMIDVASMRGLELGPLASPKVHKDQGDITYLDHASTEELKRKYATNSLLADQIDALVDVDVVFRGRCPECRTGDRDSRSTTT